MEIELQKTYLQYTCDFSVVVFGNAITTSINEVETLQVERVLEVIELIHSTFLTGFIREEVLDLCREKKATTLEYGNQKRSTVNRHQNNLYLAQFFVQIGRVHFAR